MIGSLMLLFAIVELPYGYYIILRLSISSISAYCIYSAYTQNNKIFTLLFTGCLVLYNPLIPLHLHRETWSIFNVCGSLLLFLSFLFIGASHKTVRLIVSKKWHAFVSTIIKTVKKLLWPTIIVASICFGGFCYLKYTELKKEDIVSNASGKINSPSSLVCKSDIKVIKAPEIIDSSSLVGNFLDSPFAYHDKNGKLIGIGNLSSENTGICFEYSDTGQILKIAYDELSLRIVGFSLLSLSGNRSFINFDIARCKNAFCNADLYAIPNLIKENAVIIYSAYACGAAGKVHELHSFVSTCSSDH
jgi:hypothetical protein